MEKIYLNNFPGPREWCSENVNFKSHFDMYSKALSDVGLVKKKLTEIDILHKIIPQSKTLSKNSFTVLLNSTDPARLTNLSDTDLEKIWKRQSQPVPSTSFNKETNSISNQSPVGFKKIRNRVQSVFPQKREVQVDPSELGGRKDLIPKKSYLVSFRIHEPFLQRREKGRPSRCMQQIWLLGHQKLVELRDKIICEKDYQDVRGDISENPDAPLLRVAKDLYPSSMFYFGNTCYIDKRKKSNVDYSYTVTQWGKENGIVFNETQLMEEATVDDLEVRMGYPYLFLHQGCCEHMVIINDARLLSVKDSLCTNDYPLMTRVTKNSMTYCMTCSRFPARWVVRDCNRLAHDPTFQCKTCFRMFNYINGKKVGKFRAYLYIQRNTM